jgi:hypothetical protein
MPPILENSLCAGPRGFTNKFSILTKWGEYFSSSLRPGDTAGAGAFSSEVDTGSRSNQVYADCVDLSAVANASKQKVTALNRRALSGS